MAEDVFGIVGTTQAGAYKVESVVAEGGFGVVYRAHHEAFRAPVALKCLKVPGTMSQRAQAEFLERFREEAEVMFRLSASIPAVVRPLHVDVISAPTGAFVPFMALEWLDGETLDVIVARRNAEGRPPLTLKKLVRMLAPIARALERAHNFPSADGTVSIAHRDLKPDNIFLATINGEEIAKLLDFGIAKVRSTAEQIAGRISQQELGNVSAFTPGYAAPEQWQPRRFGQTGPWTDVWGLALVVVEAAAGRPLIDGDHASMMGTAIDEKRRPTPRTEGLQVSDEVEAVFRRALAVDPRERQQDAGIFWDELERALGVERTTAPVGRRDLRAEGAGPIVREERIDLDRKSIPSSSSSSSGSFSAVRVDPAAPAFFESKRASLEPKPVTPSKPVGNRNATAPSVPDLDVAPASARARPPPAAAPPGLRPAPDPAPIPRVPTLVHAPAEPAAPSVVEFGEPPPPPSALGLSSPDLGVAPLSLPPATPRAAPPLGAPAVSVPPSAPAPTSGRMPNAPAAPPPSYGAEMEMAEGFAGDAALEIEVEARPGRGAKPGVGQGLDARPAPLGAPPVRAPHPAQASQIDLRGRLAGPLRIAIGGIVVAAGDQVYLRVVGEPIALGPIRLTWVAGAVAVAGTALVLFRLFWPSEE